MRPFLRLTLTRETRSSKSFEMLPLKTLPARQLAVLLPILLCFTTLVLTVLALAAGHRKGFMEDFAIIRLNTSMLGKSAAQGSLGIADWYSIHVTDSCSGSYSYSNSNSNSNSYAPHALSVSHCSPSSPTYRFNLTQTLDHDLSLGPLHLSLSHIPFPFPFPRSIQDKIDNINDFLHTLFVLYIFGATCSALAVASAVPALLLQAPPRRTALILLNAALTSLAAFCIFLAGIVVTAASAVGEGALNDAGAPLGIRAEKGIKIIVLSWVATGLVSLATGYWCFELLLVHLERRRARKQEMQAKLPY